MKNITGFLIKQNRLKQNLSQEGLCKGICVVSYLSKIEQGLVTPSDEIIQQLFQALNIEYVQDKEFLYEANEIINNYFDKLIYEEDTSLEEKFIDKHKEKLEQSEMNLSYHMCQLYRNISILDGMSCNDISNIKKEIEYLKTFHDYMDQKLKFLYYLVVSFYLNKDNEKFEALKNAESQIKCCLVEYYISVHYYSVGKYHDAILYATQGFNLAVEEGNVRIMLQCCFLIGTCYANEHSVDLMLKFYQQAASLARGLDDSLKYQIDYNIGASYVEMKHYSDAIPYLLKSLNLSSTKCKKLNFLSCHKLAIAYREIDKMKIGRKYLEQAKNMLDNGFPEICRKMITIVEFRYEKDYIQSEKYLELLKDIYDHIEEDFSYGYKQFHGYLLMEAYTQRRKYKEALSISKEIHKV